MSFPAIAPAQYVPLALPETARGLGALRQGVRGGLVGLQNRNLRINPVATTDLHALSPPSRFQAEGDGAASSLLNGLS